MTQTPPAAPQPLRIAYTAATRPFVEILYQCALENPEIGLITQETSISNLESVGADITLWYGEPPQGIPGYAYSLGMDGIAIIAGANVALVNISAEQLQGLYAGPDSTYQVWTYSQDNELRDIFDTEVLQGAATSSYALLAPNPAAMIEAISADPMAIGYLPGSWQTDSLQRLSMQVDLQTALARPILALVDGEPQGNLYNYLLCLQEAAP